MEREEDSSGKKTFTRWKYQLYVELCFPIRSGFPCIYAQHRQHDSQRKRQETRVLANAHELAPASVQGVKAAARHGSSVLRSGGSALDAVEAAVKALEDNTVFNAGTGETNDSGSQSGTGETIDSGSNSGTCEPNDSGSVSGAGDTTDCGSPSGAGGTTDCGTASGASGITDCGSTSGNEGITHGGSSSVSEVAWGVGGGSLVIRGLR
ncbi:hyphally-regulated protein-like [Cyprinodon tularosa]|uniref:hyphally-regulated protein-like n=1 Tax=Cyprinodon tularosa TaxID=77115 RepID=UPI0018E24E19|nr:hyphally-regulated protein-like [Cyprinodon tularosa]